MPADFSSRSVNGGRAGGAGNEGPSFAQLMLVALGATAIYAVAVYAWERSGAKARIEARVGLPLDLLLMLKEAREVTEQAQIEKEKFDATVRRRREQRRKAEEKSDAHAPPMPVDVESSDADALALLFSLTPSLLEAERLYRQVLTRLHFRGIDLVQLHQWVEEGTPTPAMRAVNKSVDAATRRRVQAQIDGMLNPDANEEVIDKRVLPYVLNLVALNLQMQADVLKSHDEMNYPARSPRPSRNSAAYRKYVAAESYFLQSLTLYRHHFQFDRRPYTVGVLQQLGTLYFDFHEYREAESVWIKCLDLIAAARRHEEAIADKKATKDANSQDDPTVDDLTASSLPASYAATASRIAENLALVHRTRGEYARSISWLQSALNEWDEYADQTRKSPPVPPPYSTKPPMTRYELALLPLPRAMHLLTALAADLFTADKGAEAYAVALQSMQVLELILQADEAARGMPPQPPAASSGDNLHLRFLTPPFTQQLSRCLFAQVESPVATSLVGVRDEAAAAYYNLSVLLRDVKQTDDAQRAITIAKKIAATDKPE